jgi:rhodanese-related sulfurtransferase
MAEKNFSMEADEAGGGLVRGIVLICLVGTLLGVSYNWFGLANPSGWGLPWIAEDRMAMLEQMETVDAEAGVAESDDPYLTNDSDPAAVFAEASSNPGLPEIAALGRPVQIKLNAVRLYVDAGAALLVDAREPDEFAEGRIPGAINLAYDQVVTDPALLENLDSGGRPIITYCGGGECEQSLSLAYELVAAGHERVAVYMGGFPEWYDADLPVEAAGEGTE